MCAAVAHPHLHIVQLSQGIEIATATELVAPFQPHQHDCYVIGLTTTGVQSFRYRGVQLHALSGQAFAIHPGELHDGRPGTEESYSYRAAYVAPELVADALGGRAFPFVREAVGRNADFVTALRYVFELASGEYDELAIIDGVTALASALAAMSSDQLRSSVPRDRIRAVKIRDDIRENAILGRSMRELEHEHGLDRFSICRLFRRHFGVSPQAYLIQRRISVARSLIAEGHTLADAAIASGFSDQSHMTRQFVKTIGMSPGQWSKLTTRQR